MAPEALVNHSYSPTLSSNKSHSSLPEFFLFFKPLSFKFYLKYYSISALDHQPQQLHTTKFQFSSAPSLLVLFHTIIVFIFIYTNPSLSLTNQKPIFKPQSLITITDICHIQILLLNGSAVKCISFLLSLPVQQHSRPQGRQSSNSQKKMS